MAYGKFMGLAAALMIGQPVLGREGVNDGEEITGSIDTIPASLDQDGATPPSRESTPFRSISIGVTLRAGANHFISPASVSLAVGAAATVVGGIVVTSARRRPLPPPFSSARTNRSCSCCATGAAG